MITLLSEIHFWTSQEDVIIKLTDYGSFKYYPKKNGNDSFYSQSKKQYCEQRGIILSPLNKRPQKLRDRLKELEEYLIHNKIVFFTWDNNELKLLLSTGLLVTLKVNSRTGDISNIAFDKQLSAKLQVNILCDGTVIGNQVICICNDGHVVGFGGQWREGWVLEGGPRRKLNCFGEWLAVWGKAGAEHPQPWSPLAKDHQRANLHLYWIGARDPELLAYKKTDGEPLQVIVSKINNRTLIIVEQKVTQRGAVSVEVSNFELIGNNLKRISVTSVPLQTQVSCSALSEFEDRLLICCIDGSLALLDRNRGSTRTVKAAFIPTFAVWHPRGAVVVISNKRGQLQYYDTALNCIKSQVVGEDCTPTAIIDLSGYFNMQFSVASINWGKKDLVFSIEQGPLAIITHVEQSMTFKVLIQKYLAMAKVDKAIKLLLSWDFNDESFYALQKIVIYLLRQPLTDDNAQHLQNALGSFHNSPVPIESRIKHRYGSQVISLTRRFFHQLVRGNMFEKAFLLAVDVGHHDLFMDLHYIAVKIGETEMAAAARAQASALLSRCSSEASICSRSSCSQCSDIESSCSTEYTSSTNQRDLSKVKSQGNYITPVPLNSDNCLTTNFNQPHPTTYRTTGKTAHVTSYNSDNFRINHMPRATYVKSPQVPSNFSKVNTYDHSHIPVPPLPYTPLLSNPFLQNSSAFSTIFQNSGNTISHVQTADTNAHINFSPHNTSNGSFMSTTTCNMNSSTLDTFSNSTVYSALSSSNLMVSNIKKSFTSINTVLLPPLPSLASQFSASNSVILNSNDIEDPALTSSEIIIATESTSSNSSGKKNQSKVKFSDTVTAFIVPEIKRPQRPPPPSHITDPQRELADSLPLCHPNEDYLKDFTPVNKEEANNEADNCQQPKIKVVHFGVV